VFHITILPEAWSTCRYDLSRESLLQPERLVVHDKDLAQVSHDHALVKTLLVFRKGRLEPNPCDHVWRSGHDDPVAGETAAVGAHNLSLV
jgi:hypothetical protein